MIRVCYTFNQRDCASDRGTDNDYPGWACAFCDVAFGVSDWPAGVVSGGKGVRSGDFASGVGGLWICCGILLPVIFRRQCIYYDRTDRKSHRLYGSVCVYLSQI